LDMILAHQYLGQLSGGGVEGKSYGDKIKDSIFGNVGTMISFRLGVEDAEVIAKQFAPNVNQYDLMNIERYNAYIRLLLQNQPTKTFNIKTFPPMAGDSGIAEEIKQRSRNRYGVDRQTIEADILERSQLGVSKADNLTPPPASSL
ncbi:MAG: hypothetical protein JW816_03205, partial [Candidatus Buchananbacteria bacterium]|nr:hypothetical protein [Candidatus Buchananbacteria bacterium]